MIVIPIYNVEAYLRECLDSVFAQETQYRFCVVAVDDGSTDASGAILDEYAFHENLTIIHQENRGYSGARNRALEEIKAKYVMFVDSDDILPVNAVESLMKPALLNDADLVAGGYTRFDGDRILETVKYGEQVCEVPSHRIPGYTCMKVIRAELLDRFMFPEGFLFEDTVLSRLVFPTCRKAYTVPEIVYHYRTHSGSISSSHHTQSRCADTFWITKYCLEEATRRGYALDDTQYKQYLQQCWVNFLRTQFLPEEIQESIFVLTKELLVKHFPNQSAPAERKYRMFHRALRASSYEAYLFVLRRWGIL
jgi:glycosyltransferase involved in cell wall biosynthesis